VIECRRASVWSVSIRACAMTFLFKPRIYLDRL
jgi:hypothetical protein